MKKAIKKACKGVSYPKSSSVSKRLGSPSKAKNGIVAAGVSSPSKRVGPVDPRGAYTKVQERTLGNMKKGGKLKKALTGAEMCATTGTESTRNPMTRRGVCGVGQVSERRAARMDRREERKDARDERRADREYRRNKFGGKVTKAKNGKSFPDLNKDGKITKADILKGRGVIAKKGMKVKKAQNGMAGRGPVLKAPNPAKYSTAKPLTMLEKMDADIRAKREEEMKPRLMPSTASKTDSLGRPAMKKGGKIFKKTMKKGGKMTKKCAYGCK
jgi:hypothetical protein